MTQDIVTETLGGTGARARRTHPVTSHEAADSTSHLVAESHRLVETILRDANRPLTSLEIEQEAVTQRGWVHSVGRIRTSLSELRKVKRTETVGYARRPGEQRRRQLWALVGDDE